MSDNPNDQQEWPPDPQDQNPSSGQPPSQQPYQQRQPPVPGQVYLPPGYQPPPPGYQQPPQGYQQPPPGYQQPPPGYQQGQPPAQYNQQWQNPQTQASTDSNSGVWGWVIFILIFGVGNLILYSTTGWLIIPIPRR
ncbi:MAG: hypothetical protein QOH25_704 [Acidobacteriota bacterium]|jgi:hypothetical protein|nr:hypothetical protein [Acidobacteriota bacterium]